MTPVSGSHLGGWLQEGLSRFLGISGAQDSPKQQEKGEAVFVGKRLVFLPKGFRDHGDATIRKQLLAFPKT